MNVSFQLITNRGNLNVYAPHAAEDMALLTRTIDSALRQVTDEIIESWFLIKADIAIALDGDRVVGMAILFPLPEDFAFIKNVVVLPPYQRQGIATKLLNLLFIASRLFHEVLYAELQCDISNAPANKLYRSTGFVPCSVYKRTNIYRHPLGNHPSALSLPEWPYDLEERIENSAK